MIQPIVLYGNHNVLSDKTKKSDIDNDKEGLLNLIKDMKETLASVGGLGLASNQIGRDESICLVRFGEEIITMVNPEIVKREGEKKISIERCLSIPDVTSKIQRDEIVFVKFNNPDNSWQEEEIRVEFPNSVVVQHEVDHLNGKMMIDNLSPMEKNLISTKLKRVSRGNAQINYVGMIWRASQKSWSLVGPYHSLMQYYMQFQKQEENSPEEVDKTE